MLGDDHLDLIKSIQDPTREARRQMEKVSGRYLADRLVQSYIDASAVLDGQAHLGAAAEPYREAASLHDTIDQQHRRLWREVASPASLSELMGSTARDAAALAGHSIAASSLSELAGSAARDAAALAGHSIAASSLSELAGSTARDAAALAGYSITASSLSEVAGCRVSDMMTGSNDIARLAHVGANPSLAQLGQPSTDAMDAMRSYFEQVRDVATALRPLETLGSSLYEQFGSTLTARSLQQQLELHSWRDPASDWQRAFQTVVDLASDAIGYPSPDDESEVEDAESDHETVALDNKNGSAPQIDAFVLAVRFTLPIYELYGRLRKLASRVDHAAIGSMPSLERMILAIASAYPQYACELAQHAHPFMQRLIWSEAPTGSTMHGAVEALTIEDADEFEAHVQAIVKVLRKIEGSTSA